MAHADQPENVHSTGSYQYFNIKYRLMMTHYTVLVTLVITDSMIKKKDDCQTFHNND